MDPGAQPVRVRGRCVELGIAEEPDSLCNLEFRAQKEGSREEGVVWGWEQLEWGLDP